jgi:hypothetical protein
MELYFGSFKSGDRNDTGKMLVCFSIPEVGIAFKAPFTGEELHTEYASLLTLLEFIEMNQKIFTGKELKIYGTNPEVINQVNEKSACQYEFSELLRKALEYKKKYNYHLGWIPNENNPSTSSLFD